VRGGELVGQINPANMYRAYVDASRRERPGHLKACVRLALNANRQLPDDYELAKIDLRPRLWTRSTVEFMGLRQRAGVSEAGGAELVSVPVGGHLLACLAYDWPDSVQSVRPDLLERWGVTHYEAMEDARSNLNEATEGYAAIGTSLYYLGKEDPH
jgi:hypothetical protein